MTKKLFHQVTMAQNLESGIMGRVFKRNFSLLFYSIYNIIYYKLTSLFWTVREMLLA